jgi:transposase
MTDMLQRLNYSYKKPKLASGKADANAQEEFVEFYKEFKRC